MLRAKLVESGWRDKLKEHAKEIIRSKGKDKVTVDDLAAEITPYGRCARRAQARGATKRQVLTLAPPTCLGLHPQPPSHRT
jgi:hypothetical protein